MINEHLHNPNFEIIDESDDFLVVNKPPHLVVHPTKPTPVPTLIDELKQLLVFEESIGHTPAILTRLDRETSGVVMVTKTPQSARLLSKAMQRREFIKAYQAIVWGWPEEDTFTVDLPMLRQRDVMESEIWVKQTVHHSGKPCRTDFRVLRRFKKETTNGKKFSLIECRPQTGRTHQIRVHLQSAGHPIIGDKIYGPDESFYTKFIEDGWDEELESQLLINRQALHASCLEWKGNRWEAPLFEDMADFLPIDIA